MDNTNQTPQPQPQPTPQPQPAPSWQPSQSQPSSPDQLAAIRASNVRKTRWGLILLIGPTALIILSVIIYAVINFITGAMAPSNSVSAYEPSIIKTVANIVLFAVAAISTLTWLPGIVTGIVLLSTRKPER